jgi:electron transfer flavoprotein beta subunit
MVDIVICMKVVPRSEEVKVNEETKTLERGNVRSLLNPADMNALEHALKIKERHGGRITLISMGPPNFDPYLRVALAVGADEAILMSDRAFAGADTLATSYSIAQGIKKLGKYDLILCGEESSDGATAQVPPGIAEWLDVPQITCATEIEITTDHRVRGKREMKNGHEVIEVPMPAVVSVAQGSNEPRFICFERFEWANKCKIPVWTVKDVNADPELIGFSGSGTTVSALRTVRTRERKREFIKGDPDEAAKAIFERIKDIIET